MGDFQKFAIEIRVSRTPVIELKTVYVSFIDTLSQENISSHRKSVFFVCVCVFVKLSLWCLQGSSRKRTHCTDAKEPHLLFEQCEDFGGSHRFPLARRLFREVALAEKWQKHFHTAAPTSKHCPEIHAPDDKIVNTPYRCCNGLGCEL